MTTAGVFATQLDGGTPALAPSLLSGKTNVWLEVLIGSPPTVLPRMKLTSVPFAFRSDALTLPFAGSVSSSSSALSITNTGGGPAISAIGPVNLQGNVYVGGNVGIGTGNPQAVLDVAAMVRSRSGGFKFPDGTVQITAATGGGGGSGWGLTGNSGTAPPLNFVGTTDNQPLELRVFGYRALRLEPVFGGSYPTEYHAINVLAGQEGNSVTSGVLGGTVGGGGQKTYNFVTHQTTYNPNKVTDNFGTVGGGRDNTAGNDSGDLNDASYATVGGGSTNTASET